MESKSLILYVEDNELNRTLMRRVLERRGYRVEMAEDGPSGLAAARNLRPDLILMDLGIPGTDGYETTRLIKSDPALRATPIIAVTAFAMSSDRDRAIEAGCDGYITKPIDVATFPGEIEKYLGNATNPRREHGEPKTPLRAGGG